MVAIEPAVSAELWVSLVSLVRSYAGVAGLHGGDGVEVAAAGDTVELSAGAVRCALQFEPVTGAVRWSLHEDAREAGLGRFELLRDGKIEQDGTVQEMDSVAIDLVARVRDRARAAREGR